MCGNSSGNVPLNDSDTNVYMYIAYKYQNYYFSLKINGNFLIKTFVLLNQLKSQLITLFNKEVREEEYYIEYKFLPI